MEVSGSRAFVLYSCVLLLVFDGVWFRVLLCPDQVECSVCWFYFRIVLRELSMFFFLFATKFLQSDKAVISLLVSAVCKTT